MSLRLDSYREAIRTAIIGRSANGIAIYPVWGFDDEQPADDDSGDDDKDTSDEDDDDKSSDDDDKAASSYKAKMQAADRRASALQKRLDEIEAERKKVSDAELSDLEKTKQDLEATVAERDKLNESLNQMRLQNAFLSVNTVTWHDPELALAQIDLESVDVGDDGKVDTKQLKAAIKELAAKKPYLVKTQDDSSTEASGSNLKGKRKGESDAPSRDDLAKRFPALNRM